MKKLCHPSEMSVECYIFLFFFHHIKFTDVKKEIYFKMLFNFFVKHFQTLSWHAPSGAPACSPLDLYGYENFQKRCCRFLAIRLIWVWKFSKKMLFFFGYWTSIGLDFYRYGLGIGFFLYYLCDGQQNGEPNLKNNNEINHRHH